MTDPTSTDREIRTSVASLEKRTEIERKFLVDRMPDISEASGHTLIQGYLAQADSGLEVRLRQLDDRYYQAVKSKGGLVRMEREIELTEEQFQELWPATEGRRVEKTRYDFDMPDGTVIIDVYGGRLEGLLTAEVEFSSIEESESFSSPEWFGTEVTADSRYKNGHLASHGIPE